jgi:hypothetical protein
VIDSFIVKGGDNDGVHGLVVEFLTDDFMGMFRGIKAERFLLVKAADEEPRTELTEPAAEAKVLKFAEQIRKGDVVALQFTANSKVVTIERDGKKVDALEFATEQLEDALKAYELCNAATAAKDKGENLTVELSIDTAPIAAATKAAEELDALVDKTEKRVDGILDRLRRFFGKADDIGPSTRVEPTIEVPDEERSKPPTDDEIAAARARLKQIHQRLAEKGLTAAA